MSLYRYNKDYFEQQAHKTGFIRDNLEKIYRLVDILEYINRNPLLKDCLTLKGGTAINLTIFNMPRLSVDIDFDFCLSVSREDMLKYRQRIMEDLFKYLASQGYYLNSEKGKSPHSLDSWVFWYINSPGNKDNIKVEVNYSMRNHILPLHQTLTVTDFLEKKIEITMLAPLELFGSKINALIGRTAARDLFDINNMILYGIFKDNELPFLKKCVLFYYAICSSKESGIELDFSIIDNLTWYKIRKSLLPMLSRIEQFDLETSKNRVKNFVSDLMQLTPQEKEFLVCFKKKEYIPELLFEDETIIERIKNHPMALWKTRRG
jgi:predicted nucleotidyltransferase component of viral defense system